MDITILIQITAIDAIVKNNKEKSPDAFNEIDSTIILISKYQIVISITILQIFRNIMQYFSFNSKLSMFYEAIRNALFDVTFFIIIQALTIWRYVFMGFILFVISDEGFSTLKDSCLHYF